jgi:hypothetical protein
VHQQVIEITSDLIAINLTFAKDIYDYILKREEANNKGFDAASVKFSPIIEDSIAVYAFGVGKFSFKKYSHPFSITDKPISLYDVNSKNLWSWKYDISYHLDMSVY